MDYLYQYTSLSALAQIVKTRSIRLNSLKYVDDPNELASADFRRAGKYCFVSSWTSEKEESIPMWNMYSKMDGVRIRLPLNPFEQYTWEDPRQKGRFVTSCIPEEDLYQENMFPVMEEKLLHKVSYTDDERLLYPSLRRQMQHGGADCAGIELTRVGRNGGICCILCRFPWRSCSRIPNRPNEKWMIISETASAWPERIIS